MHLHAWLQGDGSQITVEPGLIGGEVNRILAAHKTKHNHPIQYKIGPDPSSIDSCMVRSAFRVPNGWVPLFSWMMARQLHCQMWSEHHCSGAS